MKGWLGSCHPGRNALKLNILSKLINRYCCYVMKMSRESK